MTPKEKSKELVDKFEMYSAYCFQKQCALIAVDEIIQSYDNKNLIYPKEVFYWNEVKQEINKL